MDPEAKRAGIELAIEWLREAGYDAAADHIERRLETSDRPTAPDVVSTIEPKQGDAPQR